MTSTAPSPQTWTLRLKSRKTTVLLHIDPLQTFSSIKENLYTALQETGLKDPDTGASVSLPSSPADIQLGRPVDVNDGSQGFQLGEWEYNTSLEAEDVGKGKGKAKATAPARKGGAAGGDLAVAENVKDCAKGAGLKDGAVLAFRWPGDGNYEGGNDEVDVDVDMERGGAVSGGSGKKADMWAVQLASYEDSYGVQNETDVGGGREFEG